MRINPSLTDFLLGTDPRLRLRLRRSMLATVVYLACMLAQWESVDLGLADGRDATRITLFCATGLVLFLFAIRSGLSTRFGDAALTMPQMVFALVALAVSYHVNPTFRTGLVLVAPLVLVFGAFILPARRCVHLGWFAVAMFGATIAYGAWFQPAQFPPLVEAHTFGFIAVVVPAIAYLSGQLSQLRIDQRAQKIALRAAMERLSRIATHDELTGLPNRRHVDARLPDLIGAAHAQAQPLSIAILDLDRFKRINDTLGHAAGDDVLRVFVAEASASLRATDLLARWGGEEFLLVMPATDLTGAEMIIARMRARVAATTGLAAHAHPSVTFSAGVALLTKDQNLQQALQCADFALYDAKTQGRDRTVVARPAHDPAPACPPRRIRDQHPSTVI